MVQRAYFAASLDQGGRAGDRDSKPPTVSTAGGSVFRKCSVHEGGVHQSPVAVTSVAGRGEQPLPHGRDEGSAGRWFVGDAGCQDAGFGPANCAQNSSDKARVVARGGPVVRAPAQPFQSSAMAVIRIQVVLTAAAVVSGRGFFLMKMHGDATGAKPYRSVQPGTQM
jgi:hypothetical protein